MSGPEIIVDWSTTPWEELAASGEELLEVLDDERDALLGKDPAALERTVARKLALLSAVEAILKAHAAARAQDADDAVLPQAALAVFWARQLRRLDGVRQRNVQAARRAALRQPPARRRE